MRCPSEPLCVPLAFTPTTEACRTLVFLLMGVTSPPRSFVPVTPGVSPLTQSNGNLSRALSGKQMSPHYALPPVSPMRAAHNIASVRPCRSSLR